MSHLLKIDNARAPIIKFFLEGVSFDLSFATLDQEKIDNFEDEEYSEETLKSLGNKTMVAISGYTTNKYILSKVSC